MSHSILPYCIIHHTYIFETRLQYSTATANGVFVNPCHAVQGCELGRLGIALKLSLLNGFERNKLKYNVHVCPEPIC